MERGAAVAADALNFRSHEGERIYDPLHGTFLDGFVPGEGHVKILGRQDSADQPGGGAAVAAVQDAVRTA